MRFFKALLLTITLPVALLVLPTTAQTGVCALETLQEAFPERFELLGVRADLLEPRKGL